MRHASGLVVAAFLIAACAEAEDPALEPGPPVSGRIRVASDDPRPVANARIRWILDARPARTAEAALRTAGDGKTDADGRFEMPGPTKASGGYVSFWCEEDDGWTLVSEGVLPPGEEIFGEGAELVPQAKNSFVRMLVTGGGRPLAGARLELLVGKAGAPVGDMRPAATTDARGMVEIRGLEGGAYWADISADGFAPVRMATRQFYGDADESAHDTHDLPRARTIACRLRTQDDMPPPRASVRVRYDSERGGTLWYLPANTDGRLGIVVPRGATVELRAEAPAFAPVTEEGKDLTEVTLRLARPSGTSAAPPSPVPAGGR